MARSRMGAASVLVFGLCAALGFAQTAQPGPPQVSPEQSIASPSALPPKIAAATDAVKDGDSVILPQNTPVMLRLMQDLSSKSSKVGDKLDFEAKEDVSVGDQIVIQRGAIASGTVTVAEPRGRGGKRGKLGIALKEVALITGQQVLLTGAQGIKGAGSEQTIGKTIASAGAGSATGAILLAPIYIPLVMAFRKGEDVSLYKGQTITAVTNGPLTLQRAALATANLALQNERQAAAQKLRLQQLADEEAKKKAEIANREAALARKQAAQANVDPSSAMVVIYRVLNFVDADAQALYLDQQETVALKRGCFVGVNLTPGNHILGTDDDKQSLNLVGGQQYWIEMKIRGNSIFHTSLVAVDGQTAIHEAALKLPMNPRKIKLPPSAHLLSAAQIQLLQDLYADVK